MLKTRVVAPEKRNISKILNSGNVEKMMAAIDDEDLRTTTREKIKETAKNSSTRTFFPDDETDAMMSSLEALQQTVESLKSLHSDSVDVLPDYDNFAAPHQARKSPSSDFDKSVTPICISTNGENLQSVDLESTRNFLQDSPSKKMRLCVSNDLSDSLREVSAIELVKAAHQAMIDCGAKAILENYLEARVKMLWRQNEINFQQAKAIRRDQLVELWVEELFRFLALKSVAGDTGIPCQLLPSNIIDEAWMGLMIMPSAYAKVCSALRNDSVIDRDTPVDKKASKAELCVNKMRFSSTLRSYKQTFDQNAPELFWPDPTVPFDYFSYFSATVSYTFQDLIIKVNESKAAEELLPSEVRRILKGCTSEGQTLSPVAARPSTRRGFV